MAVVQFIGQSNTSLPTFKIEADAQHFFQLGKIDFVQVNLILLIL